MARQQSAQDGDDLTNIAPTIATPTEAPTNTKLLEQTGGPTMSVTMPPAGEETFAAPTASPSDASPTPSSSSDGDSGVDVATIAGIVFGVLGGILIIGLIIYFVFARRRKQQRKHRRDDEKSREPTTEMSTAPTSQKAPRISLRPVTQLFGGWVNEKPTGRPVGASPTPAANSRLGPNAFERPSTSQSMHPNNPFGNQAERVPSPVAEEHSMEERRVDRSLPPTPPEGAASIQDPFANPAPSGLTRKTSMRKDGPKNLDLTLSKPLDIVPASPAVTEFSLNLGGSSSPEPSYEAQGAAAIAAAGGPANTPVHRVQLDFKPTLEDEMELKAGELIRLLHEYDDGWALCIRLDRSRQGVVPRTCLSTRPVKPRNPNARPGQQRPTTPQGHGRSESPSRPRTATGPESGRPMSPGGRFQGSQDYRPRSPSGLSRAVNGGGPGPSPMNPSHGRPEMDPSRLPGQAM
jgi:hypothetical protein